MAVSVTLHGHPTATSGTLVSDTYTPTAGDELTVFAHYEGTTARTLSIADTFGDTGGTAWTSEDSGDLALGVGHVRVYVFKRRVGSSPGSGAATVTVSSTYTAACAHFIEATGQNSATPFPQAAAFASLSSLSGITTFASPPSLGSAPTSTSLTLAYFAYRDSTAAGAEVAPGSGYTELSENGPIGTTRGMQSEYSTTTPSQTANCTFTANTNTQRYFVGVLLEIAVAGVDASPTPAVVAATASVPSAAPTGDAGASPATTAATGTVPSAGPTAAANAASIVVAATATVPSASPTAGANASPTTVAALATLPAASPTGDANTSPTTVAGIAAVPMPSISTAGNVTVNATTVQALAAFPSASPTAAANASPARVQALTLVPAPAASGSANPAPARVAAVASVPNPTVSVTIVRLFALRFFAGAPQAKWEAGSPRAKWGALPARRKWS